jgi:23S rRNA (uracil1939-C5)-methyltransferase
MLNHFTKPILIKRMNYIKSLEILLGLTDEEIVYDLYTGTGTIAQFVSKSKKVIGVESVPDAIKMLKQMRYVMNIDKL